MSGNDYAYSVLKRIPWPGIIFYHFFPKQYYKLTIDTKKLMLKMAISPSFIINYSIIAYTHSIVDHSLTAAAF